MNAQQVVQRNITTIVYISATPSLYCIFLVGKECATSELSIFVTNIIICSLKVSVSNCVNLKNIYSCLGTQTLQRKP